MWDPYFFVSGQNRAEIQHILTDLSVGTSKGLEQSTTKAGIFDKVSA